MLVSHYTSIATQLRNQSALVAALKDLGFTAEVHKTPQRLNGYYGNERNTAEIIVRKNQGLMADVGFSKQADGSYSMIMDGMDRRLTTGKLTQHYAKHVIKTQQARMGYRMVSEKTTAAGEIQMVLEVN